MPPNFIKKAGNPPKAFAISTIKTATNKLEEANEWVTDGEGSLRQACLAFRSAPPEPSAFKLTDFMTLRQRGAARSRGRTPPRRTLTETHK